MAQTSDTSDTGYLVFETGGTKLVAGIAGSDLRIGRTEILYRSPQDRAPQSLARLIEAGKKLLREGEHAGTRFRAIGFGFGGTVDRSTGEPHNCLHEEGWEDLNVVETLKAEFQLPVAVENDCKLAALAEAHFGAGRGARTVFYVTLGTGVGGGIVSNGRIQALGDLGEAEIGHVVVAPDGPPCWCGGRGCVEAVCSGPGMSRLAGWIADESPSLWATSKLRRDTESAEKVSSKQLMAQRQAGDAFAAEVVDRSAGYLATALGAAINLISPQVVVVGGGVGAGNPPFLELVAEKVHPLVVVFFRDRYRIAPSELREQVVTQGAAILAAQHVEAAAASSAPR